MKWFKSEQFTKKNPIMGPGDSCLFCDTCLQYQFTDWKYTILYYTIWEVGLRNLSRILKVLDEYCV